MHDANGEQIETAGQGRKVDEFEAGGAERAERRALPDFRHGCGAAVLEGVQGGRAGHAVDVRPVAGGEGQRLWIGDEHRRVAGHRRIEQVAPQSAVDLLGQNDGDADRHDDDPQRRLRRHGEGNEQAGYRRAAILEGQRRTLPQPLAAGIEQCAGRQRDRALGEHQRAECPCRRAHRWHERNQHSVHDFRRGLGLGEDAQHGSPSSPALKAEAGGAPSPSALRASALHALGAFLGLALHASLEATLAGVEAALCRSGPFVSDLFVAQPRL